jgi:uncharacterized protein (DUF427 family)
MRYRSDCLCISRWCAYLGHDDAAAIRPRETDTVKAIVNGQVVAESENIVEDSGYRYFPPAAVRLEWLHKTQRTAKDLECPHGVQFYDVIVDGKTYERAAWVYESPRPMKAATAHRFGFWKDVKVV